MSERSSPITADPGRELIHLDLTKEEVTNQISLIQ